MSFPTRVFFTALLLGMMVSGCAFKGTRGYESSDPFSRVQNKAEIPLKVFDNTKVLDARSAFDYGLGHWSEAVPFPWTKLAEREQTGQLLKDPRQAFQRLALVGVDPLTPVIVVGNGWKGNGEEGRLAWALLYYGLSDVQTVSQEGVDIYLTRNPEKPVENVKPWNHELRQAMVIHKDEFLKKVLSARKEGGQKVIFIDVRSKAEYFRKEGGMYAEPDIQALHMEWKEFYKEDGRPDLNLKKRLHALGYSEDDEIIVFSNRGVRSGAAAYSLIANGFRDVRNFLP
jgi:thiosulfate/3-mercaptopyruvate sulfurtransferase